MLGEGPAIAGGTAHIDANDTLNALDVHVTRSVINGDTHRASVRIRWYDVVDSHIGFGGKYTIYFDSRGGSGWDLKARVNNPRYHGPFCDLFTPRRRLSTNCTWAESPDYYRHKIWFPARLLDRSKSVRFRVVTKGQHGRVADRAPDSGWYEG